MFRRRLLTVPGYLIAWVFWLGALPVWLPLAIIVDVVRRNRGVALRSATFVGVYLSCEIVGIVACAGLWAGGIVLPMSAARWEGLHFRLEAWWGATLFGAVVRIFGLRVTVEGDADLGCGPYILLLRHASTADTLLGSALVSRPYGVRLRYVLKRELLWDPCLDIVGHRIPNVFLDRFSDDADREKREVRDLARGLGSRDGVLIFPEGTRFSEAKRERVLARLCASGHATRLAYARSLTCTLPPRTGGTLGLLDAAPAADVVVCAHTGFEGTVSLGQIWNGAILHQSIRVQFRRIARAAIPTRNDARRAWLLDEWRRVDAWVERQQLPGRS